ncbi:MarR family transcriptional regulator [Pseudarthrobacter sp. PS3-L1]|uniref:MarR family winged helix-turn-helix transcriptional regulator n=1 Tax=Pseudarthrobacter sp. PS3-L1 TaxID=3046207 RepID=UPI0024B931EA|nr:MarR family transcriptional regulator [Pseudarthrobacter sp. PS3-L1]MDJ0319469.1 MarR family transcriptional regulator [Pseudarthrobacter sp. PS3-L1]
MTSTHQTIVPVTDPGAVAADPPDTLAIDLRTAIMRTSRRLRLEATGEVLTPGQYTALAQLNHEGPLTLRALADLEHVQAPSMTRIVNALTELHFVSRETNPADGRQVRVTITDAGKTVIAEVRSQRTAWLAQRVAVLSGEDRRILGQAARIMQEMASK